MEKFIFCAMTCVCVLGYSTFDGLRYVYVEGLRYVILKLVLGGKKQTTEKEKLLLVNKCDL